VAWGLGGQLGDLISDLREGAVQFPSREGIKGWVEGWACLRCGLG